MANASLGGYANDAVNQAVANFVATGTPLVVAAGNAGSPIEGYSPASAPAATTDMASDRDDKETDYTNHGPQADVFAPGTDIWFTHRNPDLMLRLTGTSMAAPHVAGAMALRLQLQPNESVRETKAALYAHTTKDVIDTYFRGYTTTCCSPTRSRCP